MKNVISQSLGLDLVNINVYAKVYQNIPLSSRDRTIFTFSEFEPRQCLGQSQMTFDNLLGYILSISMRMQNFIKIFQIVCHFSTFFTNRPASFSLFQNLNLGNALANPKGHLTISCATSCQYQCVCKILSKYSKQFKSYRHFS